MMVLVSYDVKTSTPDGAKRLRRVSKTCVDYGQRVQFSVFECLVEPAEWVDLRSKLIKEADLEVDSLRFYFLGKNWKKRVEHVGAKEGYDPQGPMII